MKKKRVSEGGGDGSGSDDKDTIHCLVKCILIEDTVKRIDCALHCLAGGIAATQGDIAVLKRARGGTGGKGRKQKGKDGDCAPCE